MARRVVTVFGGSGFLGRHVVQRLAAEGAIVRVAVRDPEAAIFLKPMGDPGQVIPLRADATDADAVALAVKGAHQVVNLVGILFEGFGRTFEKVHAQAAKTIAEAAKDAGVESLVHVSAIGADPTSESDYARTKAEGELAVKAAFPGATILRPSVVFGPEDGFFNMFASLSRITPVLPVYGCPMPPKVKVSMSGISVDVWGEGGTKFQPVYVGDVAEAVRKALTDRAARGKTFELGGPRVYSFKQLMELVMRETARPRWLLPVPFFLAGIQAWFMEWLPRPLLTRDQVKLLAHDNVVWDRANTLEDLGVTPTAAEVILPTYLHRYRPQKRQIESLA